jgi:hypothetical protein
MEEALLVKYTDATHRQAASTVWAKVSTWLTELSLYGFRCTTSTREQMSRRDALTSCCPGRTSTLATRANPILRYLRVINKAELRRS